MSNIWLTSDLHIGHANVIKYENRPFRDVDQMNRTLIENWNRAVHRQDRVFLLGDIFFKINKECATSIVSELKGHKTLIMGNHDRGKSITWWKDVGFDEVSKYPIIMEKFYMLSHEPLYINDSMPYVNVHGHIHSKQMDHKQYYNVSVELHDYGPVNFETIKEKYK